MAWASAGMRRHFVGVLFVGLILGEWLGSTEATAGETLVQKRKAADESIREALQREVYGLDADRRELLDAAARTAPITHRRCGSGATFATNTTTGLIMPT